MKQPINTQKITTHLKKNMFPNYSQTNRAQPTHTQTQRKTPKIASLKEQFFEKSEKNKTPVLRTLKKHP